ncbi:hypothetical protein ABT390_38500 [Streptomyces aurantiacus]|uniref:Uncharacterized protein n=1 Tax=Streptomyces aurantiacus JA 4570 TaxID=1286094 RepID=S4ATT1_9ACTN|nr:hypothetical protein [Streptomyces aurantiacus]EPH44822.1 hypothetical protein STRAU_2112 [Streptomyces aurantiacus JA 4570]
MAALAHVPLPRLTDGEHPLVAVLDIFAPGATGTYRGAEREQEDDDAAASVPQRAPVAV